MKFKYFFYFVLFILILEIVLRIYQIESLSYFIKNKKIHIYHPDYFIGLKPNTEVYIKHFSGKWEGKFTVNSLGMRNLEEPKKDFKKVLCLGDSLVMGYGVSDQDTFCNLLNQYFLDSKIQFLNAGIDGLGSWGVYQRFKEIVSKLEKVEYALFFVSPNDFAMPEVLRAQGFLPDDIQEERRLKDPIKKYFDHSQFLITDWFYSIFYAKIVFKQLKAQWNIFLNELEQNLKKFRNENFDDYIFSSFLLPKQKQKCVSNKEKQKIFSTIGKAYFEVQKNKEVFQCPEVIPESIQKECTNFPEQIPELPEFTKQVYKDMIQFAKEKNIKLILVIIPMQIEEIYCNQEKKFHSLRMYALQAKKFFSENQLPIIDLMESTGQLCVENQTRIQDYFIPEDGHLTKLGNMWVAKNLKNFLEKELYAF